MLMICGLLVAACISAGHLHPGDPDPRSSSDRPTCPLCAVLHHAMAGSTTLQFSPPTEGLSFEPAAIRVATWSVERSPRSPRGPPSTPSV